MITFFFAAGILSIYYSPRQGKSEFFRGPDFFVVLGTERKPPKSWVVWEEGGKYPNLIIKILSESTATTDRVLKKKSTKTSSAPLTTSGLIPISKNSPGFTYSTDAIKS